MAKHERLGGGGRRVRGALASESQAISFVGSERHEPLQIFRSLADHSQEFIGMCDLEFRPLYVNEAGRRLVGLGSMEEACAVRVQDFFFPEDQRFISEEFFPKVLREGRGEVEVRFRHFKTGATLWMIYNVFQLRDGEGRVRGYATVSRDVTERKRAEMALLRSRDQFELLSRTVSRLLTSPDPQRIIEELCNEVRAFLDCAVFFNFVVDRQAKRLRLNACGGVDRRLARKVEGLELRQSLCGSSVEGGCRVVAENLSRSADPRAELVRSMGIRAYACHPLLGVDGHAFGTLSFGADNRDGFSPEDLELMRAVASHAATALMRQEAEETVRKSEEKFRALYESIDEGVCVFERLPNRPDGLRDYRYLAMNRAMREMFRIEDLSGRSIRECFPYEAESWYDDYDRVLETGQPIRLERESEPQDMILSMFVSRVEDGSGKRLMAVMQDVTRRRRAEQALRESEERLRLFIEHAPASIAMFDREMRYLAVSHRWVTEYLPGCEGVIGRVHYEVFPECPERWRAAHKRGLEGEVVLVDEDSWRMADGRTLWARYDVRPWYAGDGSIGGIVIFTLDFTERKQAEEALREAEERLRRVLEVTGVGLWLNDMPLGALTWDARTRDLFFVGPGEEASIELFWSRLHPEDREPTRRAVEEALRDGTTYAIDHRTVEPGTGRVRWIHSEGRAIYDENGKAVRFDGINYDITERRAFQSELERLVAERTAKLQELVAELEHFSYTITHDLKSPLRAMRGFAEMAGSICERSEVRECVARISTSAERMDRLIADALSYSRAVRQELPLEDVDTGALLRGMLDSYPEFQTERARIRVEGRLPVVLANEAGLTQCFSNLLGNAVKFVRPGEMPEIRVWASQREGWVRIWVEDKGIGIPKEMLPRVFDMFARGSKDYEGTGIGLALVRKVTQRMGGKAGVESEQGKGSRFWIELKCGEAGATLAGVYGLAKATAEKAGGTVLYVEDEESDALFMERAFAGKGLAGNMRVVRDGRAAIDYLSGSGEYRDRERYPLPGVVLLDLNLPQVPGFQVLEWMRNHPDFRRTPVVIFSSSAREDDRLKAQELGANEFLCKPNSGARFGEVVEGLRERWLSGWAA